MSNNNDANFKITLKENGLHSLWRGIEAFENYNKTQDKMLLKDAIMFFHHGIELLMKEILVRHSEYLIFEDLGKDTIKKQREADREGVGIFFLPKPPKTVTYLDAISRVEAFIKPVELDEPLVTRLNELNQLRNQLEHYAIDADVESIVRLLGNIRVPLLNLFEAQIGGVKQAEPPTVDETWQGIENLANEYQLIEQEVARVVKQFNGQKVPGRLFNVEDDLTLPNFSEVVQGYRKIGTGDVGASHVYEVDVFAQNRDVKWVIEVKAIRHRQVPIQALYQVASYGMALEATPWLIVFGEITSRVRETAKKQNIFVTGIEEWKELKQLIGIA